MAEQQKESVLRIPFPTPPEEERLRPDVLIAALTYKLLKEARELKQLLSRLADIAAVVGEVFPVEVSVGTGVREVRPGGRWRGVSIYNRGNSTCYVQLSRRMLGYKPVKLEPGASKTWVFISPVIETVYARCEDYSVLEIEFTRTNLPTDYPDATTHSLLGSIYDRLYDVKGSVEITNMPTDYLREGGSVNIANLPAEYPDTVAHSWLGSVFDRLHDIKGTVEVPGVATEATLGSVLSKLDDVRGSVNVLNFPTDYPDAVAHSWLGSIHSKLDNVKGTVVVSSLPNPPNLDTKLSTVYDDMLKIANVVGAGTVYVGTIETTIVLADANRVDLAIYNSGPGTLYIGPSGAAVFPVPPDGVVTMTFSGALYGSADQDNTLIRYLELKL